jgi:transmembrane sensor
MNIDQIYEEAAAWLVRQEDDAMDWGGFTAWLEADPGHRAAYAELALIDQQIGTHAGQLSRMSAPSSHPANDSAPVRWPRWAGFGGSALAAGLALTLVLQPWSHSAQVLQYRSLPGQTIEVALRDGAHVVLAPASRLAVQGERIELNGTGYFDVPHHPGRTLTIAAGDFRITDIGTRFSVENEPTGVNVGVGEGAVSVSSEKMAAPIRLSAGQGIRAVRSSGSVRVVKVDPKDVASWRDGRLQFDETPLVLVASEISRYSGKRISVDPVIAKQPFSGVIAINHGEEPAQTLAQILSLDAKTVDGTTRLEPRHR